MPRNRRRGGGGNHGEGGGGGGRGGNWNNNSNGGNNQGGNNQGGQNRGGGNWNNNNNNRGNNNRGGQNRGGGDRGDRGGRGGGRGNWNNNNRGGNNNGNRPTCQNCGRNGHRTEDCRAPSNSNSFNNNNRNNQNNNQNGRNNNRNSPCTRCGLSGHNAGHCTAIEKPPQEICPCGCVYHFQNQCHWNGSPVTRDQYLASNSSSGKICQWCKPGPGDHDFSDCADVIRFRQGLESNILKAYDSIQFCWHCRSMAHFTRACDKTSAREVGEAKWRALGVEIVEEWVNRDVSAERMTQQYLDGEVDFDEMVDIGAEIAALKVPKPEDYLWCVCCQEFGHSRRKACDATELNKRKEGTTTSTRIVSGGSSIRPQPQSTTFGIRNASSGTESTGFGADPTILFPCQGCQSHLTFRNHIPKNKNDAQFCVHCSTWVKHPYLQFKQDEMSDIEKMAMAASIGTAAVWGGSPPRDLFRRKSSKKEAWKYRPSVAIPRYLAVSRWPETQPRYDTSTRRESSGEYLFNQEEDVFNVGGNHQSYFPPQLIRLTDMDRDIRDDDRHPINKAGRMGLIPVCITCNTKGLVRDAEGDIVMCKTEAANTVAMGKGTGEWDRLCDTFTCRCPFFRKGQSLQTWVHPDEVSF
ncbi:hypothetical protein K491DRAFT_693863 [Lophiostoma macrostomum CBS 122681]|uniref:CCHC-type domain-containing protein n=1 Tax=Lophiostoma macrostomum CBS 122681 TaxID=1314788 RepID=A0A6A6T3U3_9PLEO|nr:hypothetical protein K491DRAFT_693863 [Lophiostoma macrostomum CBS 122681]